MTDQRGATLVELIVAVSIFALVIIAVGTLYATVTKVSLRDQVTQDLQREGDAVLTHMSRSLRTATEIDAANSNFTASPHTLQVKLKTTGQTRRYYVTGNQLHYVSETGTDENLLAPGTTVTSLTYSTATDGTNLKSVRISMTLSRTKNRQTVTLPLTSTVDTRPQ